MTKYRKARTKADINADPRIEGDVRNEGNDGWWANLKDGFQMEPNSQVHGLHEYSIKEMCEMLNLAVSPCQKGCPCGHGSNPV
ncbi:MAG: hypothetical protein DRH30_00860 [Deltaproteobacteria bacterium]|nr:MAG: hypothetical protein DRH30_00860 [Deltaproteobacteria bacterium]